MANFDGTINPAADWSDVPQLGASAVALGGAGGTMNAQAVALSARDKLLMRLHFDDLARSIGYTLVAGSFEDGATITNEYQVLLQESAQKIYSWTGAIPGSGLTIPAGSTPTPLGSGGWIDRSNDTLHAEYRDRMKITAKQFKTVADAISSTELELGDFIAVDDYATGHESGVLFFRVVAAGTGVHDGGKYIDAPAVGLQLEQNLKKPYSVKAWGAAGNSNGTPGNGADDRNAIYAAYQYCCKVSSKSSELFFPNNNAGKSYRVGSSIELNDSDHTYFVGEGGHYTASKISVDFDGVFFKRTSGQCCNSFRNLVFQSANPAGYPSAAAIYTIGTVESTLEECSFLDFGGIACNLNACFGVRVIHPLVAGNYTVGLKLSGGSGNVLDTPVYQDNLGTAGLVEGAGWTIINPYFENNCKRNDPATENGNYYNLYVNASQTTIVGGTLNQYPQDTKVPIRIAAPDVTIIDMNAYSLAASHVANIESSSASLTTVGCSWGVDGVSGVTKNHLALVTPLSGYRKADIRLGGVSVSDNISKAWCNFNGTLASPITPRTGANVGVITKIATGTYRVNFSTLLSTNTYAVKPSAGGSNTSVYASYGTKDVSYVDIYVRDAAGVLTDVSDISVEIKELTPA